MCTLYAQTINVTENYCKPINQILIIVEADVFHISACDWLNLKLNQNGSSVGYRKNITAIDITSILIYVQQYCCINC